MRKLLVNIGKYLCVLIPCLQKTCKTFSWSRNWSQIQIPRPQLRASLGQTSCQELPGNFDQFDFVVWLCFCTLMFLAQSSLLAAWLSQALLQISITWSSVKFHILFQLRTFNMESLPNQIFRRLTSFFMSSSMSVYLTIGNWYPPAGGTSISVILQQYFWNKVLCFQLCSFSCQLSKPNWLVR